jgi:hypothetical protein
MILRQARELGEIDVACTSLPAVGEGILSAATLAWSEPLTALPRSARSRVSSSRSLCKAATRTLHPPSHKFSERPARAARPAEDSEAILSLSTNCSRACARGTPRRSRPRRATYGSGGLCATGTAELSETTCARVDERAVTDLCREVRVSSQATTHERQSDHTAP